MLRNKNISNSLWNIADIFLYPLLFFMSTAFFIRHLGQAQFGIWMLINTIIVSMQLFNFGIGSMVLKNIALHTGRGDADARAGTLNHAISITILLFGFCILLSGAGYFLVSHFHLFAIADAYRGLCAQSCALAGWIVGIKFFEQIFTNYFKALEQYKTAALLSSGNRLGGLLLNVLLLCIAPMNIAQLLLVIIIMNALFILFAFLLLQQRMPAYRFRFTLRIPRREMSFAVLTWLQSLAIILTFQSDRYLVVSYFGLIVLSYYALIATMFNHLHMGLNAVVHWISPKFTKLHAQAGDSESLYFAARSLVASCAVVFLLVLYFIYPFLFRIVLGSATSAEVQTYTRYFICFESFFALSIVPTYYFNAVGHEKAYLYYILIFCGLALGAMFACIHIFHEPQAVLYGLIAACVVSTLLLTCMLNKILTGKYQLYKALLQLLPSVFLTSFICAPTPLLRYSCAALALATLYFTHLRGGKHTMLLLARS
ncbi:hypothetical protein DCC81_21430 [Chitinophaga parva]|uniref:Polysaccharide biosynthesis protein n=1 Tax=Chitinophaga parva TaxID=2169414 RepID=A0A2T7BD22_9BACT|nr:hypothetical protein [Chitinophaga parva]PUZ22977.1 hypothetical protein DCC81_21430 [Chitinophaga parva]